MSLIKQLWLATALLTTLSFGGSFIVSTLSARHYLQQELALKNMDNATSLALSMSQMPKDEVSVELQIAAQFDAGHYRLIRLTDPAGKVLAEREFSGETASAPRWFMTLVPIGTRAGIAQVQDGWQQFGTLQVETHDRYAYDSLWTSTQQLLWWFLGGGLLTGLLGTFTLKRLTRPLEGVVEQAEAIGKRRFITIPEPRTLEFRSVVRALNTLSERIRTMLVQESQSLEQLRRQTQHDELTGLFNRPQFLNQLDAALSRDDAQAGGSIYVLRITNLAELNRHAGRAGVDAALVRLAAALRTVPLPAARLDHGRLNASEFALLIQGEDEDSLGVLDTLTGRLRTLVREQLPDAELLAASARYTAGETRAPLLARLDGALASAEQSGASHTVAADAQPPLHTSADAWRQAITEALEHGDLGLHRFPVLDMAGRVIHYESPVRLRLAGNWLDAGRFLPWAARCGLAARIDAQVLATACETLAGDPACTGLAINLSAEALGHTGMREHFIATLQAHRRIAPRLWVDVQESSALRHPTEFRMLCAALGALGCKLGLKHGGQDFARFAELHDLGLDYIKISAAFVRDIDRTPGNQTLVRSICTLAHSIGLKVIAEGVGTLDEASALAGLGLDGMTGPGLPASPRRIVA
ncbi:EAL domain-containing protein [Thauera linaloolentis]|nr:EAL domain-containing protein [Thauera linaloolentis]MCM8565621.1 EAL domain-containing protein [Thauera linaloolentis]